MRSMLPPVPDAAFEPFDDGVGVLSRDGVRAGHVAFVRGTYHGLFDRQWKWWIWYIVIWEDGTRERSQEDYEPYLAVQEIQAGYLDVDSPANKSMYGRYDFVWLPREEAEATRARLGIQDSDF
ncbi:hypothetical protein [Clavibacter michiganensis]|uniref:hypothetical protein n=2 Tax=Clavibacter michiganensis TaxID=28447 RepID=UPI003DA1B249